MAFRTLLAKGHRLFRNKSTQDLPGDLQNTATVSLSSATTNPQKKFEKTSNTDPESLCKVHSQAHIFP